jgi:hypothetical protein
MELDIDRPATLTVTAEMCQEHSEIRTVRVITRNAFPNFGIKQVVGMRTFNLIF